MALLRLSTAAALRVARHAQAQVDVVDATGRTIRPPARVERVYGAGPPAGLLYAIAPRKLLGKPGVLPVR